MTCFTRKQLIIKDVKKKLNTNPAWILLKKGKEWLKGRLSLGKKKLFLPGLGENPEREFGYLHEFFLS